jgi:hypothetical protein
MFKAREIAFIDPMVADIDVLLAGIRPDVEPIVLRPAEDAVKQIARAVEGRDGLEAIHIVAHGEAGAVHFMSGTLSRANVDAHADDLAAIGGTLDRGELRLWTCETAQGEKGAAFVAALACATGAQVAASTGLVGSAAKDGRWELDARAESPRALAPLTAAGIAAYRSVLGPSISNWNGALTPNEQAAPVFIDTDVSISSWNDGSSGTFLRFGVASAIAGDQLTVATTASAGVAGISVTGSNVYYVTAGGTSTQIGTIDGTSNGANGAALQINLNSINTSVSDDTVVTALARAIQFQNTSDTPPAGARAITLTANDADSDSGTVSSGASVTITADNDAPVNLFDHLVTTDVTHSNADAFASANYGLSTGTDAWAGSWTEGGESTSPGSGDIQINSGRLRFSDISDEATQTITRQANANLANATSATLSFDYTSGTNDLNEYVTVQISTDGNSWTNLGTIGAGGADGTFSQSITNYISGTTYIRFSVPATLDVNFGIFPEYITIDNLKLDYVIPTPTAQTDSTPLPTQTVNWISNPHVVFSSANNNAIKVSDADSANLTVALHVEAGTLTLGDTGGLSDQSGNGTDTVTLSGTTASINAALNGLTYHTTSHDTTVGGAPDDTLTITTTDGSGGTDTDNVNIDVICFMAGTMIRTPACEMAVESLKRGDLVLTSDGRAVPVTWLGRQTVSTVFADPLRVLPIRIRAGALGESLPARDLLVSPDHALFVGGVLVHAGALVNGTSIVREDNVPKTFTYYHVEVDDHALILAENVPAETFIDNVDRLAFDNWDEHQALYPDGKAIAELPYPRAKAHRQVPQALRKMLAARSAALAGGGGIASAA